MILSDLLKIIITFLLYVVKITFFKTIRVINFITKETSIAKKNDFLIK